MGGGYERSSVLACVLMAAFDGTLPVCSRCACQHVWVERCASEELFPFKRVGGTFLFWVFLSVCWRIYGR